jgi:hypothetical protein
MTAPRRGTYFNQGMVTMKKTRYALPVLALIMLISCRKAPDTAWQEIDPSVVYPDFTYRGLKPACSSCPAYTDLEGKAHAAGDPSFKFFFREGSSNNLVVYFQGGGACWATENCLYEHTYTGEVESFENVKFLQMLSRGSAEYLGYGGIFDFAHAGNPLRDWDFVYIPYCTADLHAGARDYAYPSAPAVPTAQLRDQYGGAAQTIRHRGKVNFQAVLKWIKENRALDSADKILVTGISGGSYGAMLNFSNICEAFPDSTAYLLGDAGNGVIPPGFLGTAAPIWGMELPGIAEFAGSDFNTITIAGFYAKLAGHYTGSRIAQYTTKYDNTQSWFYNIQLADTINYPDTWGSGENNNPGTVHSGGTWEELVETWSAGMQSLLDATVAGQTAGNYTYYVGAGRDHTVLMSRKFYTEKSGGASFVKWVEAFISGDTLPESRECASCGDPVKGAGEKLYMHN